MTGVSEAFYEAMQAISSFIPERPFPSGLNEVETDDWELAVNCSKETVDRNGTPLAPYNVIAIHKQYVVIACFGPEGGIIGGGMTEDEFIKQMRALAAAGDRS